MTNSSLSLLIADDIAVNHYYEGMLIHPTDLRDGMVVMRSNDSDLILNIYKITMYDKTTYYIERHLLNKAFATEKDVQAFLDTFSTFRESEFNAFIKTNH